MATGAQALAMLGDSVTTDHISPAGSIAIESPVGQSLMDLGVNPAPALSGPSAP